MIDIRIKTKVGMIDIRIKTKVGMEFDLPSNY